MVFVRVGKHDTLDVGYANSFSTQAFAESFDGWFGFWSGVDEGEGIFVDEVDIDCTDVERCGYRDGDYAHENI